MSERMRTPERAAAQLRQLYGGYGYAPFKVQKFERYDLYAEYKRFLESEQILTFTDTDGRLMAMKPDVTLSIVKDTLGDEMRKVFYHENVYREQRRGEGFKEIPQMGLECIGDLDAYSVGEVVMLAARSLEAISSQCILDVSHLGVVSGVLEGRVMTDEQRAAIFAAVAAKNTPALKQLCPDESLAEVLSALVSLYGPLGETLEKARIIPLPQKSRNALEQLEVLNRQLEIYGLGFVNLDFSVVNDVDYYDDVVFRGFVEGAAQGVLSGGRYDRLLQRMGKPGGAIGFAVYLDRLERVEQAGAEFDADVLILCPSDADAALAAKTAEAYRQDGKTVRVQREQPEHLRFQQILKAENGEVKAC